LTSGLQEALEKEIAASFSTILEIFLLCFNCIMENTDFEFSGTSNPATEEERKEQRGRL
jgi:hypothetical protein